MLSLIIILIIAWIAVMVGFGWPYRHTVVALWREPVLRYPVLIIESDDWGPGPEFHGLRLERLREVLSAHHDRHGHHPVMTLGVVLALPDTETLRANGLQHYARLTLGQAQFEGLRSVIDRGIAEGVFALQLHGMEHYWPPALIAAARTNGAVRGWLTGESLPNTEGLPSALQSRWIDASQLPSRPIPEGEVRAAVQQEIAAFAQIFGKRPALVVPPTFVWNATVEQAWADAGVVAIVTPGRRYEGRDAEGKLERSGLRLLNGQSSRSGPIYIVRDDYFEPALGHTAQRGLDALENKSRLGRPTLLETHRFNFTGDEAAAEAALAELDNLLTLACSRHPGVRFLSTEELARRLVAADPEWIESGFAARFWAWLWRLRHEPRVWRFAKFSGLALPVRALLWAGGAGAHGGKGSSALGRAA